MADYVRYDDTGVEPLIEAEDQKIQDLIQTVNRVQERNFSHHRHGFRATHVKTQAIVKGQLSVLADLPARLSQGLFSKPGQYPIGMRYANEPSWLKDDRAPGPRGVSIKVFNVNGAFLDEAGAQTHSQDFTFNNAPVLELRDLNTCLEIFQLREANFDDPEGLEAALKKREDKDLQFAPASLPNQHFLSYTMYSQSAYRYGDYVAKFGLFPVGQSQQQLENLKITDSSSPEQHSKWLQEFFATDTAEYEFRIQLCRNLNDQSVEDCSVEWDEKKYPFETVAKVVLPPQNSFDSERRAFWDDQMKLNVWYGLEAHQPLGSANRLRKKLYQASMAKRGDLNAAEVKLVSSIDQIP